MNLKFLSLRKKLLVGVFLISTVVTIFITAITFYFDYKQEMNTLNETLRGIQVSSLPPLARSIWDFNENQINAQLKSLVNIPSVVQVDLKTKDSSEDYSFKDPVETEFDGESTDFVIHYTDDGITQDVGTLKIYTSSIAIREKLFKKLTLYIGLQSIKTLILSYLLMILFQALVTRHLEQITARLKEYQENRFSEIRPIQLKQITRQEDEITQLIRNINLMAESTYLYQKKVKEDLQNSEQNLEVEKARSMYSSKMAALGEMSSGIAHEINNPLSVIMGKMMILKKFTVLLPAEKHEEYEKHLSTVAKLSDKIAKIIRGLKNFSREGSQDPFMATSLGQIIEDTNMLLSEKIKRFEIDYRFDMPNAELSIECRSTEVSQVLLNLLSNAADAIKDFQEKWIKLQFKEIGNFVEIIVTDSGSGIPLDVAEKMMQPFFTTKPIGEGTGLGLSISKGLIENHGGELILNRDCANTQFIIRLPKVQATSLATNSAA